MARPTHFHAYPLFALSYVVGTLSVLALGRTTISNAVAYELNGTVTTMLPHTYRRGRMATALVLWCPKGGATGWAWQYGTGYAWAHLAGAVHPTYY